MSKISKIIPTSELNINTLKKTEEKECSKISFDLARILNGQEITQKDARLHCIKLSNRNDELLKLNKKLSQQLERLEKELNVLKEERKEKAARKRLPKREPITPEIYRLLIKKVVSPNYTSVRLRIAFCLLTITGIQLNELLPLKVNQLQTLLESYWIKIDRLKRGPANHKAFLTREGRKLVVERKKDFESLFLLKNPDSYVFTSELNHNQMLSRETITRDINKVMHSVSKSFPDQPTITSHSFRVGYISQLWKDTNDIEFVKQTIGHRRINITSSYVGALSDQERKESTLHLK